MNNLRHNKDPIRAFKNLFNIGPVYTRLASPVSQAGWLNRAGLSHAYSFFLFFFFYIKCLLCPYEKAGWYTCRDPRWTSHDLSKQVVFFKKLAGRNKWKRRADKGAGEMVEWSLNTVEPPLSCHRQGIGKW